MTELLTAAQMRAVEAAAIASGEVTGLDLMERAGRGVVEAIFEEWPELRATSHRAVVLCGPGNNGGDGFVVARLMKEWGWEVKVFLYGDPEKLPPDARVNYERWSALGETQDFYAGLVDPELGRYRSKPAFARNPDFEDAVHPQTGCRLLVDALFGKGLARPIMDINFHTLNVAVGYQSWASNLPDAPARRYGVVRRVAVDVPSGILSDSGKDHSDEQDPRSNGPTFFADLTVTFHAASPGMVLGSASDHVGKLVVKDIGLPGIGPVQAATIVQRIDGPKWAIRKRDNRRGKYSHGHALILSGPSGRGGAARLAARGALRIGAGVVTVGAPAEALAEHAARLDAVMLREVGDGAALAEALEDARINALCLGPGMGVGDREAGLVGVALGIPVPGLTRDLSSGGGVAGKRGPGSSPGRGKSNRSLVLDADALTLLSRDPALFGALHATCVLTPHAGEFARLFPDIAAKLAEPATRGPAYSKVDATREAAKRAGCVVLYKGPDTVIADPSGRAAINSAHYDRAAPWLATAGSGDVLAGFITGLLARGFDPFNAACTAAWLHVECARAFGPGLIAEDLPEMLPKVFRDLGL